MASRAALAATRSLDVLSFLAAHPQDAYSLTELAHALEVNPSSMFGILSAMADAGYLVRHPSQKTYRLGPIAAAVGVAALNQDKNLDAAADEVRRLAGDLETEAVVATTVAGDMVTLACAGPPGSQFLSFVGQRVPHAAPIGSIFAAWADEEGVVAWLNRAHPALNAADQAELRKVLGLVRRDGQAAVTIVDRRWRFAVSPTTDGACDGGLLVPLEAGVRHRLYYVAVPVFDRRGDVLFGLFATGTSSPVSVDRVNELSDRLNDAAESIMTRIGGRTPAATAARAP